MKKLIFIIIPSLFVSFLSTMENQKKQQASISKFKHDIILLHICSTLRNRFFKSNPPLNWPEAPKSSSITQRLVEGNKSLCLLC